MTLEEFKEIQPTIPKEPGVYKFISEEDEVLYVGKAKVLRNRVSNYFSKHGDGRAKVKTLVRRSARLEFTIVNTEQDALLLECTLIKKYQPKYNVMLKDGKSYSYICIKKERFPRVFLTRKVVKDGSTYFGPYMSKWRVEIIADLIRKLFKIRTCHFNLSSENIQKGKFKVCLEYHIKNCEGPCVGYELEEHYQEKIHQIKNVLKGNFSEVKKHLKTKMQIFAEMLEFEKAQEIKEQLRAFEDYQGKSTVVSTTIKDVDVFSIAKDDKMAYVNYLKVVNGALINIFTQELKLNLDSENDEDLLAFSIPFLREKFNSTAPEIVVPFDVVLADENINLIIPKIGDKKKLLDLSIKNVLFFKNKKGKEEASKTKKKTSTERILNTIKEDLQMDDLPLHIECFDNSNLQGTNPVASCVVFKNGKPSKRDYRHFNIKTVVGPDDFASMTEIVYRRYSRLLKEGQSLPQLVIIDGGKGQLSASMKSITQLGLENKIVVVGIAKRLEEIFFPGDSVPLYINKKSESLKVIQHARNESHRFAITFHRNQRSKNFISSKLVEIPGIGDKTAKKLLQHFKSVKKIQEASYENLFDLVGKAMANKIIDSWSNDEK
jgi:excinuclease ABC subunit C